MIRKKLPLALPFRYFKNSDASQDFDNRLYAVNKIGLDKLIGENRADKHIVVFDYNKKVAAFIIFKDLQDHFYIVLVETNDLIRTALNPGSQLIDYVEQVSILLGYKKIVLDSTDDMITRYQTQWRYRNIGYTYFDPQYGRLTRMEKILT